MQENKPGTEVVLIEGQATLTPLPAEVHIGEPVVWTLSVQHGATDGLRGEAKAPLRKKDGWVLLEGPATGQTNLPDGSVRTEVSWTYMALRPGSRTPADYGLTLKRGAPLHVEITSLQVLGELEEGEDAPRPMAPIRPIEAGPSGHGGLWLGAGLLALLVFIVWRMSRRGTQAEPTAAAPSVLQGLKQASLPTDPSTVRESLFVWHRDLRSGIDYKLGEDQGALTDGPWLQSSRELPGAGDMPWSEIESVLGELERLKYLEPLPSRLTLSGVAEQVVALANRLDRDSELVSTSGEVSQ
ncbi:MAG: hypothetical protein P1V35_00680 [Planctomycetota bacterium]|nr:hypothetical protein [Planctomycetota bacterium]